MFSLVHASLIDLLTEELVICLPLFIKTYLSIEEVWWSMYLSNNFIKDLETETYLGADLFLVPFKNISNFNSVNHLIAYYMILLSFVNFML